MNCLKARPDMVALDRLSKKTLRHHHRSAQNAFFFEMPAPESVGVKIVSGAQIACHERHYRESVATVPQTFGPVLGQEAR